MNLSRTTKGQIWAEAIAGPQALFIFAVVLIVASIYFFALGGATPQERQMKAPMLPITSDFYSALYTVSGQQTYIEHIQTRYQFPDELRPLLQEMLNFVPENAVKVSTWPEDKEIVQIEPPFPGPQYAGYIYPSKTTSRAIIIPTTDPEYNIILEMYTLEYKAVGGA